MLAALRWLGCAATADIHEWIVPCLRWAALRWLGCAATAYIHEWMVPRLRWAALRWLGCAATAYIHEWMVPRLCWLCCAGWAVPPQLTSTTRWCPVCAMLVGLC